MMPVGEVAVIELLLKWLRRNGVDQVMITTGYLGHLIRALCGDGSDWDLQIHYSEEKEPLGTVGALHLVSEHLDERFLMVNGDLITNLSLRSFVHFHNKHGGLLSVATTCKTVQIDLGVLETDSERITEFREKPALRYTVNMGIYCMEPEILQLIPKGVPYGFDDLIYQMLDGGHPVHAYKHEGQWLDIGRPEDFARAQDLFEGNNFAMLRD